MDQANDDKCKKRNRRIRFTKPALIFLIVFFSAYITGLSWLVFDLLDISFGDLI